MSTHPSGEVSYAVFCVCANNELVSAVMTATDQVPQAFFAGEFRDYISSEKRPQFSLPIKQARACLALIDFDRDIEAALKTVERLHQIFSNRVRVIGVAAELPAALLLRAIRAGCSDFLPSPPGTAELTDAIRRFQQTVVVNPAAQASVGKVVAFFGAKGGVGTTTLAVHLAGYLIACHGKKTLLIDHKHQLGHVALYLGLKDTQYHFDELMKNVDRLDAELLTGFAIRHGSGLDVMASPEIATAAYESKRDDLERVMDFLRSEYDYILIDSSVEYQQTKMSIIAEADEVYLVSTPDVAALRDLARLVEHIGLSPSANGKLRLIINRSTADDSFTPEQIQKAVRFPVSNSVPNNYGELLHAINQGVPIAPTKKSAFNDALATIAREIVQGNAPPSEAAAASHGRGKLAAMQADLEQGRQRLLNIILQLVGEQQIPMSAADRDQVAEEVLDEVFGLGPLEPLLKDPTVSDILVNTFNTVYVERKGVIEKTSVSFRDNAHLMHIIDKIVSAVGRRIDESSPLVDARLLDGSRVNIIIPPLAVDGPLVSIRRFSQKPLTADDLLRHRAMIPQMLEVLRSAVQARLNIVVSGGTGAGKTTLLNVLSGYISPLERIVTIEDSAELQIKQEHVARLECRPPNMEGKGAIRQRELVINALRMRPDRIILGECRGEEALDMLQAMNTGHDGSITTVHANTPRDAISRMETMCMMGTVVLPERAIRAQIASAIDLIVQVSRMSDGTRRITHITEVTGTSGEIISLQDIFLFEKQGLGVNGKVNGRFFATGIVPKFAETLAAAGVPLSLNLMDHSVEV